MPKFSAPNTTKYVFKIESNSGGNPPSVAYLILAGKFGLVGIETRVCFGIEFDNGFLK
jgi:hypothetical protein